MFTYNIYFIPFQIRGPYYLELLKANINGDNFKVQPFSWKFLLFTCAKKDERRIIHIHWETNVYGSKYLVVSVIKGLLKFPAFWLLKKIKGVKIVWTMHNLESHDYPHPRTDALGRRIMWLLADKVLLHEKSFALVESNKRKGKDIECIPPGNYVGVYGPMWEGDRNEIKKKYDIDPSRTVLLALGSVRPYKALEPLIEAVLEANKMGANLHLYIAGNATQEYGEKLNKIILDDPNITFVSNYVADEDIAELHGLADYSALYYGDSALGSAAILLSLSYGVPVISRDFAVSELVVEGKNGFKFHDKQDLVKVLEKLRIGSIFNRQEVLDTVMNWDWKKMGEATRQAYVSLYKP